MEKDFFKICKHIFCDYLLNAGTAYFFKLMSYFYSRIGLLYANTKNNIHKNNIIFCRIRAYVNGPLYFASVVYTLHYL